MNELGVDFGKTASDYTRHRAGFPTRTFERLAALGVGLPGQRLLDVGTGTGALARVLAARGARVTALDPSQTLLDEAMRLAAEEGVSLVPVLGTAEATGLPDSAFDAVTAGQCWHWLDGEAAARELSRVLVPGGALAILHFDWLGVPGSCVEISEQLIMERSPAAGALLHEGPSKGTGIYVRWTVDVGRAGFVDLETFSFDVAVPYTSEDWRGRIRASAWVGATRDPDWVADFDAEHARRLGQAFPDGKLVAPHRVWALVARRAGGTGSSP
jgi:SAM-dependent methyltransferase